MTNKRYAITYLGEYLGTYTLEPDEVVWFEKWAGYNLIEVNNEFQKQIRHDADEMRRNFFTDTDKENHNV